MPETPTPEIPQEAVAKFHALPKEQQQTAISRMTPELKAKFLPVAQEYKAMHAPDSAYKTSSPPTPQPTGTAAKVFDKTAQFATRNAPTIAGGVGAAVGSLGGPEGSVMGAVAGGAAGGAIKSRAEQGKVSGSAVSKAASEQGLMDVGGGLAAKGLTKAASLLGIDESLMKFALKRGEDFSRDLNPAAAMNKYHLQALATRDLYQKTAQKIGTLSKTADAMIDQVSGYSSTVRPYAIVKGVIDQYKAKAAKVGSGAIKDAMDQMLDNVGKEFNNATTGAQGLARQAGMPAKAAESLPTDRLMTTKEANQLKRVWGESVPWGKEPPKSPMEEAHMAVKNAQRDIYHALNSSISDAMGGNQGRLWRATDHDIFNLMEAKGALQESGERIASDSKALAPRMIDAMRMPGPASTVAAGARNVADNLSKPGVISNIGRAGAMSADAMMGQQNPMPMPQK